ncbi:hypothetical protein I3843_03G049500, partial [Carya illinoinensis]
ITAKISQDLTILLPKPSIFRTPNILSRHNPQAYIPDVFSFDPLHRDNPNIQYLETIEKIKERYLKSLISRSRSPETMLRELVRSITSVEREARECYAVPIGYASGEFVTILITDGCFIIELFRTHIDTDLREVDDPIFTMACMLQFLYNDLILLENQVPWMVLEHLHRHILDLLRKWWSLSINGYKYINKSVRQPMPSATSLVEAGIEFKRGESNMGILNISFKNGILEIPPLLIQETTETVFCNLIAFEQCYPECEAMFTSYAVLLDSLISTTKDINILCKNNILDACLKPEDAVQFFRKLNHNTYLRDCHYLLICQIVRKYRRPSSSTFSRWRVTLVDNYFFSIWAGTSTVAATALLVFAFVQTVFTIIK